jgi:uncharacterized protein (TIGR02246 family)
MHARLVIAIRTGALIAAMLAAAGLAAQSPDRATDEAAVRAVIQAFIAMREAGDAAGLAALLTADVDQQQTSGNVRRGREAVVTGTMATQASTGGRRTITVDSLRFLASDVALADARYDSVDRSDGTDRHMRTSMVLKREGDTWKIAAIRNMLPTGG